MNGKLIVFEGGEGAGKTTQIERTRAWLSRHLPPHIPLLVTREPGGTHLGTSIRSLLLDRATASETPHNRTELLLYAADRAQHVETCLRPALADNTIILCDRYTDSTVAYQGYGRGLNLEMIEQLNRIATGGLKSDLTLWLDLEVEIGLERARRRSVRDRMEAAELTFHKRVRAGFEQLAGDNPQRIVRIDASLEVEKVSAQIEKVLRDRIL
ncbi:dTMP kinase [Oscillatoria sp. FACHB-1406]|uniref:dTMP kinase n=1 Tax=Oscillatoria sp. FACHB-1406 TaxID=2692846 RepID=UPI0016867A20|nr:dTMP kinase [Oscillatoria sp. FACHB-1406]MBD2578486.1 dTMP kinase [Oscillatoria sp. FACHB-1406]